MTNPHQPPPTPVILSTLWIYVLLSTLFRDIHEIFRDGFIEELAMTGTVRGTHVTSTSLVVAGLFLQLPIAMVVAARLLPPRANRVANSVTAIAVAAGLLGLWPKDADDIVFGAFQLVGLAAIIVLSLRWPIRDADANASREVLQPPHDPTAHPGTNTV